MVFLDQKILSNSPSWQVLFIILMAVLVRVILFFMFDFSDNLHGGDSGYYLETGRNIMVYGVHGEKEIATFIRAPMYSFFAGIVANISETALFFYIVQSVLFICFSVILYLLLYRYGKRIAFISALLIAMLPFDALLNGRVLSENLVTPFIVLATLLFVYNKNSKATFFVSGMLLGAAALSRDIYLLLPFFFLVAGIFAKIKLRYLGIFLLGATLLIAPWMYRNSQLPSAGIFLSKGIFWPNLWVGTWMGIGDGNWYMTPNYLPPAAIQTFNNGKSPDILLEAWNNRYTSDGVFFKKTVIEHVTNHPLEVIGTMIARHPGLWVGTRSDLMHTYFAKGTPFWYVLKGSFYLLNAMIILFALPGIILVLRSKELPIMLCVPVLYTAMIYFPFYNGETRYSQPVIPILIIFSVYFILWSVEKIKLWSKPKDRIHSP